jgi:hypothetical protein
MTIIDEFRNAIDEWDANLDHILIDHANIGAAGKLNKNILPE